MKLHSHAARGNERIWDAVIGAFDSISESEKSTTWETKKLKQKIIEFVKSKGEDINPDSIRPADYCYNRVNEDTSSNKFCFFEYVERGKFKVLGENFLYEGYVYHRKKGEKEDKIFGEWKNRVFTKFEDRPTTEKTIHAMTYKSFYLQDAEFKDWRENHPNGIIINSSKGTNNPFPKPRLNSKYLVAHTSKCDSFGDKNPNEYSKHCFDSLTEAEAYISEELKDEEFKIRYGCHRCKVKSLKSIDNHQDNDNEITEKEDDIQPPLGCEKPKLVTQTTNSHERDPRVVAYILGLAKGKCELCRQDAPFITAEKTPYLEVHHVKTLANLGSDKHYNAVALCPNCHRAVHYAKDKNLLVEKLYETIQRLKREE